MTESILIIEKTVEGDNLRVFRVAIPEKGRRSQTISYGAFRTRELKRAFPTLRKGYAGKMKTNAPAVVWYNVQWDWEREYDLFQGAWERTCLIGKREVPERATNKNQIRIHDHLFDVIDVPDLFQFYALIGHAYRTQKYTHESLAFRAQTDSMVRTEVVRAGRMTRPKLGTRLDTPAPSVVGAGQPL